MVKCTRENVDDEFEHKKELLKCQCVVCTSRLVEYSVRERDLDQSSLEEFNSR